jgi:hypothetical protein
MSREHKAVVFVMYRHVTDQQKQVRSLVERSVTSDHPHRGGYQARLSHGMLQLNIQIVRIDQKSSKLGRLRLNTTQRPRLVVS